MLLSQKLLINRSNAIGVTIPSNSDEVIDLIVLKLTALSGSHQRYINISRCSRLTSNCLNNIGKCQGLLYLNISYTTIENISPLINLPLLKSLSIAGLHLINYDDIKWLVTLEILNTQFSNFSKPELLCNFNVLRSLDFGHTPITNINGIQRLTRLEELYLDSTPYIQESSNQMIVNSLVDLSSLKLLQIGNSNLTKALNLFQQTLPPLVTIVTKPRR